MKIFAPPIKDNTGQKHSTFIEIDKEEVIDWNCDCIGWSFFLQSKKNMHGMKPCIHILKLYKRVCIAFDKRFIIPDTFKLHSQFGVIDTYLNRHFKKGGKANENQNKLDA